MPFKQTIAAFVVGLIGGWNWDDTPAPRGVFAPQLPQPPAWLRAIVDSYHAHPKTYAAVYGVLSAAVAAWYTGGDARATLFAAIVAALPGVRVPGKPSA